VPVRVSADLDEHRGWLAEYAALGFDDIYLHHVGQDQSDFLEAFGERVLPTLREGNR
jgi:alkanesulfonate monooxygenase SsuD/methylene tetrahydromethanopterin reductase-like flavin-dependent oxidoreductase (luciferase family)